MAGPILGVIVGPALHMLVLWALWAFAERRRFPIAVKALVLSWALFAYSEGTVQIQDLITLIISAYVVDFVLGRVLVRRPEPQVGARTAPSISAAFAPRVVTS